ncbi:hypothetical protein [Thalassobacter stenotrophicus]|uniref:hypothetical protein n=1 Tax=Thalassobacter stenotrophicus TaxID=266809 RepID=UPI000D5FAB39|nr:hypothetical protein [Thalassobacter stenotrophicus]PVZ47917.1 hypothetical protein DD557_03645 [Thalassobacter stenotrophicus]
MTNELHELFAVIRDEEQAATTAHVKHRIDAMVNQDDGPIRSRIFAGCIVIAGAELVSELYNPDEAAKQLRRLADRIEAGQAVKH